MLSQLLRYSATYSSDYSDIGLVLFLIFLFVLPIIIISYIIDAIPTYKLFKKAGIEGWKAFVPIYQYVVKFDMVNINPIWILVALIPGLGGLCFTLINIVFYIRICKALNKDTGFVVGLVLINIVFMYILAFDSSTWDTSRIDMQSMSFLNKNPAPAPAATQAPEGGTPTAAANANTTPEDPWVAGNDK